LSDVFGQSYRCVSVWCWNWLHCWLFTLLVVAVTGYDSSTPVVRLGVSCWAEVIANIIWPFVFIGAIVSAATHGCCCLHY
jgi:hypothetical protein